MFFVSQYYIIKNKIHAFTQKFCAQNLLSEKLRATFHRCVSLREKRESVNYLFSVALCGPLCSS